MILGRGRFLSPFLGDDDTRNTTIMNASQEVASDEEEPIWSRKKVKETS